MSDLLRREQDHVQQNYLKALDKRVDDLAAQLDAVRMDGKELNFLLRSIDERLQRHEPAIVTMENVIGAGFIFRWIIIAVVGTLTAVTTAATAWEAITKWSK